MATSEGTVRPRSRNSSVTPDAIWSLPQKMASTSGCEASNRAVACRPQRIPSWTTGAQIRVNGAVFASPVSGAYATVSRTWVSGDVVDVTLPMALTRESTNDNASVQAVKVGPIVLGGLFGTSNLSALPALNPAT